MLPVAANKTRKMTLVDYCMIPTYHTRADNRSAEETTAAAAGLSQLAPSCLPASEFLAFVPTPHRILRAV